MFPVGEGKESVVHLLPRHGDGGGEREGVISYSVGAGRAAPRVGEKKKVLNLSGGRRQDA